MSRANRTESRWSRPLSIGSRKLAAVALLLWIGRTAPCYAAEIPKDALQSIGYREAKLADFAGTPHAPQRAANPAGWLTVTADFNGDGKDDEARILLNDQRQVAYIVVMIMTTKLDTYVLESMPLEQAENVGIALGAPTTASAGRPARATLTVFRFDGGAQSYSLNGEEFAYRPVPSSPATVSGKGSEVPVGWVRHAAPGTISGVGSYTFAAPAAFAAVPTHGIDSYLARYESPAASLVFDFGVYGNADVESCRAATACQATSMSVGSVLGSRVQYPSTLSQDRFSQSITYKIPFPPRAESGHDGNVSLTVWARCSDDTSCKTVDAIVGTITVVPEQ